MKNSWKLILRMLCSCAVIDEGSAVDNEGGAVVNVVGVAVVSDAVDEGPIVDAAHSSRFFMRVSILVFFVFSSAETDRIL